MKTTTQPSTSVLMPGARQAASLARRALVATATLLLLIPGPGAWTQNPGLTGPTPGANLRQAAVATQTQVGLVRTGAKAWGQRAGLGSYRAEYFNQDYANARMQFLGLRQQFNVMATLAIQFGRPSAANAMAELDAGLNIIGELFPFLENEYNAGTLDQKTIVRTCDSLERAMREWERELKKSSSRFGLVW